MNRLRLIVRRIVPGTVLAVLACAGLPATAQDAAPAAPQSNRPPASQAQSNPSQSGQGLVIENDSQLPEGYPHRHYELRLHAHGAEGQLHWKVEKGALPPGMKLDDSGLLLGDPERPGEFQFTVSVTEGGNTQSAVQKMFVLRVIAALAINWRTPAHVNGNRIEGSVSVTNTSPDDMDLTFVAMAVAGNGRATAIGYQRFTLRRGTVEMELPFGETLPHGGYVIHVDAVGEVAAKNLIFRDRMQTPGPLQVTVGP
jgi:Putative Ig domain